MSHKIDPAKVTRLKPGRRTRGRKQEKRGKGTWEPHRGDSALDAWGVAIRELQKAGTRF